MDVVSYILAKKYVDSVLSGAGALKGESAYDIAVKNGFQGHGIGRDMHEDPGIPNYGKEGKGIRIFPALQKSFHIIIIFF